MKEGSFHSKTKEPQSSQFQDSLRLAQSKDATTVFVKAQLLDEQFALG